jgi:hypothetical protein
MMMQDIQDITLRMSYLATPCHIIRCFIMVWFIILGWTTDVISCDIPLHAYLASCTPWCGQPGAPLMPLRRTQQL